MAGRRHHTIPQFMLRAFESSKHAKESRVWCYRRDCEPIELNVTKIGVEKDFYGKELDDRITELESGFAPLVDDLRARSGPVDKEVADLVAHLTLRTRALRQSAIDLARKMTDRIRDHVSQPRVIKAAVRKKMPNHELLKRLREELTKAGMSRVEIERRILSAGPKLLAMWEKNLNDGIEAIVPVVDKAMREGAKRLPASMRLSFIDALSRGLDDNPRVRAYRRFNWFVLPTIESLVLGDCACIFEADGDRQFKPWDDETSPGKRIFMPISPRRLLIGAQQESKMTEVDVSAVNQAFARCSLEFFISARRLDSSEAHLIESIGLWSGIADDGELNAVWEQIKNDL
jgi:hypothetical protein